MTPYEEKLLSDEAKYCSHGDTVHYVSTPKIFDHCKGSYLFDAEGTPYLDLQMWYSAVNFGYANPRLDSVLKRQIDVLPQIASQYLHPTKIELSKVIAQDMERKFGLPGRVHYNVGGSQSIDDSLKLVRNYCNGKSRMFAFEGGIMGAAWGVIHHLQLSLPASFWPLWRACPVYSFPLSLPAAERNDGRRVC